MSCLFILEKLKNKLKYSYPFENEVNAFILSNISIEENMRCIDLGCGNSNLYKEFLNRGCFVYRVDMDNGIFFTNVENQNNKLFNINKEISSINSTEIGSFDFIIFSLVSLYNSAYNLENIWKKIDEISYTHTNIFCIDLHPISKFENFPWRTCIKTTNSYWDIHLQKSYLNDQKSKISIQYYHHTLESLFINPLRYGYKLNLLYEFPEKFENINMKYPAYLCSKWTK